VAPEHGRSLVEPCLGEANRTRRGLGRHSVNRRAAARDPPLVAIPAYFSLSGLAKFLADCTMISERSLLLASVSELSDAFTL
jgi:hypothetical protein